MAEVNIVKEIPEDKQKEIAKEIKTHYDIDLQARSAWEEKRNRWYKLWTTERNEKTEPWPGCANVCIPMLAMAANQFHARSYQSVFAPPGMVKTIPVGDSDLERARRVEKFMNWQTLYEMEEYEEVFDKLLLQLPVNGVAFKKLYYDADLDRPVSEYISALDLVLPYGTKRLESARRMVHRLWLYYDELKDRADQGLYENFDNLNEQSGTEDQSGLKETQDEAVGEERHIGDEKPHLILECYKPYSFNDGKREPYTFWVDYETETLMRAVNRNIKKDSETVVLKHFIDYHFLPNPEGFYSFGFGHFLETLNEMANTAFNQIFDSGRLTNQPFGFYGRRAGIKERKIQLMPGLMKEVEDAKQVYFPTMQRVDQVLFQILGLIQQYTEQFTSTSDYLMGRESRGTKTPTAHGTLAIIEQGLVTFAVMTKRIFRSLRKELRLIMLFNQLFMPDSKEYRILEDPNVAFPSIKREDFTGIKDVIPIGDPSYASKFTRRQEAVELYGLLMENPLVAQNPKSIHALTDALIDAYDRKDKRKILPELPEESFPPEVENAKFMQGDKTSPKMGEDHATHIRTHAAFMASPSYQSMPEQYKEAFEAHMQATRAMQYMEEQARQQMGGM
jgi:hypothetical protein